MKKANKITINLETGRATGSIKIKSLEEFLGEQLAEFILKQQANELAEVKYG